MIYDQITIHKLLLNETNLWYKNIENLKFIHSLVIRLNIHENGVLKVISRYVIR